MPRKRMLNCIQMLASHLQSSVIAIYSITVSHSSVTPDSQMYLYLDLEYL
jgi:hypothetical protein